MIDNGTTIGLSISGALTPAGLSSVLVPLIEHGFIEHDQQLAVGQGQAIMCAAAERG